MAKNWGSCDFRHLQKLRDNLAKLEESDLDKFCRDVSKELAARLLALVIPRTPVGDYKVEVEVVAKRDGKNHKKGDVYAKRVNPTGKMGGTLRWGWTARTEQEAAGSSGKPSADEVGAYVSALPVAKAGNEYRIEVINPVKYASYVEFGHRTRGGKGWVDGQYFLTLSEQDLRNLAPGLIEKKLEKQLQEVFHV